MAFTHSSDKAKTTGNRVTESQRVLSKLEINFDFVNSLILRSREKGWPGRLGKIE
jgi:hypothetical protein